MKTLADFQDLLNQCDFPQYQFVIGCEADRMYMQVQTDVTDTTTGEPWLGCRGRKWWLSPHMTDTEVVMTAFKAVLTFIEHEVRENFMFKGRAVFGPHINIYALYDMAKLTDERTF